MKKFSLLSLSALVAASAAAGLTDVTPKAYDFSSGLDIPFVNAYKESSWGNKPWNPAAYFLNDHPELYKDGLVLMIGPVFSSNYDQIISQCYSVVDLGGEVGKVLLINHPGSDIANVLKNTLDMDLNIPEVSVNPGYMIPFWHSDPDRSNTKEEVKLPMRVRIVLNIYDPAMQSLLSPLFQPYIQMGGNWVPNEDNLADRQVYGPDFALLWGEVESEDSRIDFNNCNPDDLEIYTNDDDFYVWNPNRWMVYEWDVLGASDEDGAMKIKMEIPGSNAAVFIKSIQFLLKDAEEESIEACLRRKSWVYYNYSGTSSITETAAKAEKTLNVTVDGSSVSFDEPVTVFTTTGVAVAKGMKMNLTDGMYIAIANDKAAKFVVK